MTKPYIVCYMMMSVDGRIDCGMTAQLRGDSEYYSNLDSLNLPTRVSGRRTAQSELAQGGTFKNNGSPAVGKDGFSRKTAAPGYEVVLDTRGTLLWSKETSSTRPHLIIMSRLASQAYLDYLDRQNISWIVAGDKHIDLAQAASVLADKFGVKRMGLVGGPTMNTGFLNAGLIDEIDLLVGPGIDGRRDQESVFEGRTSSSPLSLKLVSAHSYDDGAVLLTYRL